MNEYKHYLQIDILKALAIISVIILHTIPTDMVRHPLSIFTVYQAVPIFFVLMATNALMSFKRHNYMNLSRIYPNYLKGRFQRIIYPLIIVWMLSLITGILLNKDIYIGTMTFIGYLPLSGPGNYFISILIQFVLIFPILYKLYRYNPKYLLITSFILNLAFEILATQTPILNNNTYWYKACILRYLFLITLGMWFVNNFELTALKSFIRTKVLLIGLTVSIAYMIGVSVFSWNFPYFQTPWQPQVILSFFYPLILCAIGITCLPSIPNHIWNGLSLIGKASYHIFLIQIIFFVSGLQLQSLLLNLSLQNIFSHYTFIALTVIGNIIILIILGLIFYYIEPKISLMFNQSFHYYINRIRMA